MKNFKSLITIHLIIQALHNTVSADKELRKYLLSEEEWICISDIHKILQVIIDYNSFISIFNNIFFYLAL